jgi:hypothetical protein
MKTAVCAILIVTLAGGAARGEGKAIKVEKKTSIGQNNCAKIAWSDAAGRERAAAILLTGETSKNAGGYIVYLSYYAGQTLRECKAGTGLGYIVMHGARKQPGWATSIDDSKKVVYSVPFQGPHHVVYRAAMDLATDNGPVLCTVEYFFRTGRSDFLYLVTFDSKGTTGLNADTRSPYVDFDWEGNGTTGGDLSGFGWAAANKQFRTLGDKLTAQSKWDWTKPCVIPHVIEWKNRNAGDAEIGLVQTQTFNQHDGGDAWWSKAVGTKGTGLPENWNLPYQLNAYQGYSSKRTTWMMPYGAVGAEKYDVFATGRKASGKPYQGYSLLCVLDRHSEGGVDAAVSEMVTVQTQSKLTATVGTVVEKGPAGVGRTDQATYSPPGWNHVYAMWTVACEGNAAECNLAVTEGSLPNPTFCFTGYTAAKAPKTIALGGKSLAAGSDYYASLDAAGKRLLVTFNAKFEGEKNAIEMRAQ